MKPIIDLVVMDATDVVSNAIISSVVYNLHVEHDD